MPFLHQEGHVLVPWKACSRMLKGVFFVQEERILEKRGAHPLKYPDILCLLEYLCFFTENIFFSHRTHSGPSPNPSWPLPLPLPRREGRNMWGYPYWAANMRINRSVHPSYRGISVITPLPFGEGKGEGPAPSLNPVCYVHLCSSVREKEVFPE